MNALLAGFVAGLFAWTLIEYAIHYWLGHLPKGRILISSEHLKHHTDILYFTPLRLKLRGAVPVLAVLLLAVGSAWSLPAGTGFVAAVALGWTVYETLHQSIHVHGPRSAYGRWAARHHLHHHFMRPQANHGVTTPIWDHVFRTYSPATWVRVPRRSLASLPWLEAALAAQPDAPAFVADYEVA